MDQSCQVLCMFFFDLHISSSSSSSSFYSSSARIHIRSKIMEDPIKYYPPPPPPPPSKLNIMVYETKQTMGFVYGFMTSFFICILLILLSSSSPNCYFKDIFHISQYSLPNYSQSFASDPQNTSSVIGVSHTPEPSSVNTNGSDRLYDYESMLKCDLFDGKWVRDDSYPLYPHGSCPYISEASDCFVNGRPDSGYESYRWQPNHCNIPRLKGKDMLELIRGKRLVFVGDSLNRNMWDSLMCILWNSVEDKRRVLRVSDRLEFKDYNCSVEFSWSPFLAQVSELPSRDGSMNLTVRLDLMDMPSDGYKNADILIFNSGHWYTDGKTSKGRNFYREGSHVYGELSQLEAYRKGMTTWRRWVEANVNPMKTQVFFRGYSATHFRGGEWNSGGRCEKETEPFKNEEYLLDNHEKSKIFESVLKGMKTPIHYLNITRLTDYRKDAHPSIYNVLHISEKERFDPVKYQDCLHWCLPGVPDTWNEILYSQLLINHSKKHKKKTVT